MLKKMLAVLLILLLAGCASTSVKQASQLQPTPSQSDQELYAKDYSSVTSTGSYEKISETSNYSAPLTTKKLSKKQIQIALKNAGFYKGTIDGNIGPKSKKAILEFQKSKGLKADGVVGKKTSSELRKYL